MTTFQGKELSSLQRRSNDGEESAGVLPPEQALSRRIGALEAVTRAAWADKPSWAVIATDDKSFDQAMLQHMASRAGAKITNVSPKEPSAT